MSVRHDEPATDQRRRADTEPLPAVADRVVEPSSASSAERAPPREGTWTVVPDTTGGSETGPPVAPAPAGHARMTA